MAHAMTYGAEARALETSHGYFARLRKQIADFRLYRRTLDELAALTDRELSDLGISRLSIRDIARDSVYGA